jgi:hypothetical protein
LVVTEHCRLAGMGRTDGDAGFAGDIQGDGEGLFTGRWMHEGPDHHIVTTAEPDFISCRINGATLADFEAPTTFDGQGGYTLRVSAQDRAAPDDREPCGDRGGVTLDFETSSEGTPIVAGTALSTQWSALDVTLSCTSDRRDRAVPCLAFDSSDPTGNDPDLGTPNEAFGGPGRGAGGASGAGRNDGALGHLAIIAENTDDADGDGLVDDPDDEARGGEIRLAFKQSVDITSVTLVDIDADEGDGTLRFETADGIVEHRVDGAGDNSVQTINLDVRAVNELTVSLSRSGALAEVVYQRRSCPPEDADLYRVFVLDADRNLVYRSSGELTRGDLLVEML